MIEELVVVALPIGNTEDLSFRSRKFLERADGIIAEDTRKFKEFTRYAGLNVKAEIISLPGFTEKTIDYANFFKKLKGKSWGLVSDAGTPAVSDPGAWIIRAAAIQKIKIKAFPGPSALTLALQLTGGFGLPATFLGFPPKKNKEEFFVKAASSQTLIFFESKHEIINTLSFLSDGIFSKSKLFILRELTKEHEEILEGIPSTLLNLFKEKIQKNDPIGELTLVMEGSVQPTSKSISLVNIEDLILFKNSAPTQSAKILSKMTGISKEQAYEQLKNKKLK